MDTRIPECIRPVLNDYLLSLQIELLGLIDGCYIHGSIALNAFNPYLSDIDFITILRRRATTSEVKKLKAVHKKLELSYPQWKLEGSYLLGEDIGRSQQEIGDRDRLSHFSHSLSHQCCMVSTARRKSKVKSQKSKVLWNGIFSDFKWLLVLQSFDRQEPPLRFCAIYAVAY